MFSLVALWVQILLELLWATNVDVRSKLAATNSITWALADAGQVAKTFHYGDPAKERIEMCVHLDLYRAAKNFFVYLHESDQ